MDSAQTLLFHTHIISISPPFQLKLTFNMMITAIDPKMCEWWWCQKIIQSEERREAIISFGGNNQRYIYLISSNFLELLFSALWTNLNQKDAMYIGDTPNAKNLKTQFGVFINIKILNIVVPDLPNIFWALFWFKMDHCAIPMISVVDIELENCVQSDAMSSFFFRSLGKWLFR